MKELYERKDAERILNQAILNAGSIAEFWKLHDLPDNEDVLKIDRLLAVLNLRKVEAFERIEK